MIQYTAGDGNDIIYGFKADSTLSIASGVYATEKSGYDLIVTVRERNVNSNISLEYGANLSKFNIRGTENKSLNTVSTVNNISIYGSNYK